MEIISVKNRVLNQLLNTHNFSASLDQVRQVICRLQLAPKYTQILIGGTNGKGSTCAYLTTILTNAGYSVGTYTSPHVFEYNERIAINNKPIDDHSLVAALEQVMAESTVNLGLFKAFTLAAHLIFAAQHIDIAIIEVGLGGGKDVTNLFTPDISALTTVALDHCAILGATREAIGWEKAQIFRRNHPAVVGDPQIPASVVRYAQECGAELCLAGKDFQIRRKELSWDFLSTEANHYSLPLPSLRGTEQVSNAALALAILTKLKTRFPLSQSQIKTGLLQTTLIGRFQVLPGTPQIVLDTAHNPQAVETMLQNMVKLPFAKQNLAVLGIAGDKDWQTCLELTLKHFNGWYLAPLGSERSCDPLQLQHYLVRQGIPEHTIKVCPTIQDAFGQCYTNLNPQDRVVCFGSFLVVESAYLAIKKVRN